MFFAPSPNDGVLPPPTLIFSRVFFRFHVRAGWDGRRSWSACRSSEDAKYHQERVAETLRDEIGAMIEGELSDPRISFAYISQVVLNPGGKSALIYVAVDGGAQEEADTLEGLMAARGYIRHELLERMGKRYVPELTFHIDRSEKMKARIDELLGRKRGQDRQQPDQGTAEQKAVAMGNRKQPMAAGHDIPLAARQRMAGSTSRGPARSGAGSGRFAAKDWTRCWRWCGAGSDSPCCSHARPDGDAVGSMLACGMMLDQLGKQADLVSADPVPHDLSRAALCFEDPAGGAAGGRATTPSFCWSATASSVRASPAWRVGFSSTSITTPPAAPLPT